MTGFFDWLAAGDWGAAAESLRADFKLSHEEMRRTTDALAPAFLLGLQRALAEPATWARMMEALPLAGPANVSLPVTGGPAVVSGLFGPYGLADGVARQASLFSGVAPDTIARMMPSLALMTVDTLLRMSGWRAAAGPNAWPADAAGQALAETMRRSANALEAFSQPSHEARPAPGRGQTGYLDALFADALKGGFPWLGVLHAGGGAANMPFQPFGFFNLLAPMQGAPIAPSPPESAGLRSARRDPAPTPYGDFMDAGRTFQEAYLRQMLSLFERHAPKSR